MRHETRTETRDKRPRDAVRLKKGFTILELLVASLLLGMLMTVLTMIFNQSSISWRVGGAAITDLDKVSEGISSIHDVADNLYVVKDKAYLLTSIWEEKDRSEGRNKTLRQNRPFAMEGGSTGTIGKPSSISDEGRSSFVTMFGNVGTDVKGRTDSGAWSAQSVGQGQDADPAKLYTVNVKSAGPNKTFNDYDDIWSFPDDFD